MRVRVVFYGRLHEETGSRAQWLELEEGPFTIQRLADLLLARYPGLRAHLPTVAFSVGAELVGPEQAIRDGDEVGLLPPVSGGCA